MSYHFDAVVWVEMFPFTSRVFVGRFPSRIYTKQYWYFYLSHLVDRPSCGKLDAGLVHFMIEAMYRWGS